MTELFHFIPAQTPLLISAPHCGTEIPPWIAGRMTRAGLAVADTDWHVEKLYAFAPDLGAGLITATQSRYVVDLNRDPDGRPLYPGADNTELAPLRSFAYEPLYQPGAEPDAAEIAARRDAYWAPYHAQIRAELDRLRARFGVAILWDGHSIRSHAPRFFDGRLPDFNLGTSNGKTAGVALTEKVFDVLQSAPGFSSVLNGRFTGGYITRHYGEPDSGIHALQLEMAEIAYMDEDPPFPWDAARAAPLEAVLRQVVETLIAFAS